MPKSWRNVGREDQFMPARLGPLRRRRSLHPMRMSERSARSFAPFGLLRRTKIWNLALDRVLIHEFAITKGHSHEISHISPGRGGVALWRDGRFGTKEPPGRAEESEHRPVPHQMEPPRAQSAAGLNRCKSLMPVSALATIRQHQVLASRPTRRVLRPIIPICRFLPRPSRPGKAQAPQQASVARRDHPVEARRLDEKVPNAPTTKTSSRLSRLQNRNGAPRPLLEGKLETEPCRNSCRS